jgi:hypothetical protein
LTWMERFLTISTSFAKICKSWCLRAKNNLLICLTRANLSSKPEYIWLSRNRDGGEIYHVFNLVGIFSRWSKTLDLTFIF